MNTLPFLISEFDLNLRLARVLIIINNLSVNKKGKPMLDMDKIAIFEFLIKYPSILYQVLESENKHINFDIHENEKRSIESQFPNGLSLYDFGHLRGLMKILLCYEYIEIQSSNGVSYTITEKGKQFVNGLESAYLSRINVLSKSILPLQSVKASHLINKIKPHIKGA